MAREKLLTVRASEQSMSRLQVAALLLGETMSEFVRRAVSERIRVVESSIEGEGGSARVADLGRATGTGDLGGSSQQSAEGAMDSQEGSIPSPPAVVAKVCRHGYPSCRICKTGRFAR